MRIGIFLMSLSLAITQVAASQAAPEEPKLKLPAKAKLPTNLRGSTTPDAPAVAAKPAPVLVPYGLASAPRPTGFSPAPQTSSVATISAKPDVGQCRTTCAHTYYFCLSGSISIDCADSWSQCLTDCSHPPLTIDR